MGRLCFSVGGSIINAAGGGGSFSRFEAVDWVRFTRVLERDRLSLELSLVVSGEEGSKGDDITGGRLNS